MSSQSAEQRERNEAVLRAMGAQTPPQTPAMPYQATPQELWVPPANYVQPESPDAIQEGNSTSPMAFWVLLDGILGFVIALILQMGAMVAFIAAQGLTTPEQILSLQTNPTFTLIAAPTLGLGMALMAVMRVRVLRRLPWSWFNLHKRNLLAAIGWGALAGIIFLFTNAASSALFSQLGSTPDQAEQLTKPFKEASALQLGLLGLFVVFIGPFLEEIFFRGYAQRAFRQKWGVKWGIVLSAALFALPHVFGITTGYIGLLVPIFLGGLILGYIYQRTDNLWSAVVAHCINNAIGFLGLLAALSLTK